MRNKLAWIVGWVTMSFVSQAQIQYALPELIQKAEQHYPLLKQKDYLQEAAKQTSSLLNASLIPTLSMEGQGTYQSEVTSFSVPGFSGIPTPKKNNYYIGLDLHVPLTDFGTLKSKKDVEEAKTDTGLKQIDVDLQKVRERVTNVVANILLQQENKKILQLRQDEINSQLKKITVAVSNGAVLRSNQLVFESELLNTEEKMMEIDATLQSLVAELSILTGEQIVSNANISLGVVSSRSSSINRAEIKLFNAQIQLIHQQRTAFKHETLPRLSLFSQGNYGRPGYNFLNNNFRLYGIVGLGLQWNINNFILLKGQNHLFDIRQKMIEAQEENFSMNLQIAMNQKETEINKYDPLIQKDEQIVAKRKEISAAFASQLDNGVITSTDYLTELNATNAAELVQALHKIQKSIALTQYNLLSGN